MYAHNRQVPSLEHLNIAVTNLLDGHHPSSSVCTLVGSHLSGLVDTDYYPHANSKPLASGASSRWFIHDIVK